jgi:hypothetical protein
VHYAINNDVVVRCNSLSTIGPSLFDDAALFAALHSRLFSYCAVSRSLRHTPADILRLDHSVSLLI